MCGPKIGVEGAELFKGIRYFSVAVRDLEEAIGIYAGLGMEQNSPVREARWGFRNTMMGHEGQNLVELIQVSDANSALGRFMKSRANSDNPEGEGIYLVSMEVDDLPATIERIQSAGGRVATDPESPNTAWVHPLSTRFAFLELSQRPQS